MLLKSRIKVEDSLSEIICLMPGRARPCRSLRISLSSALVANHWRATFVGARREMRLSDTADANGLPYKFIIIFLESLFHTFKTRDYHLVTKTCEFSYSLGLH